MLLSILLITCALIQAGLSTSSNASLLWGPYRPNLYLGIRPRIPNSLLMGLMWSNADNPSAISESTHQESNCAFYSLIVAKPLDLRHTCEQDEGMAGYGWTAYDVRTGGMQTVNDTGNKLDLVMLFAKVSNDEHNGNWGLRFRGIPRSNAHAHQKTTMIFYLGNEDAASNTGCTEGVLSDNAVVCNGTMVSLRNFKLEFPGNQADGGRIEKTSVKSLKVPADTIWQAKSIFTNALKSGDSREGMVANDPGEGNLHFVQKTFEGSFEFDVLFSSDSTSEAMTSTSLTGGIQHASSIFSKRFMSVYAPQAPFQDDQYSKFSQSLLSNVMGGIGYFYGTAVVDVSSASEYAETDQSFWEKTASARLRAVVEEQGPYQLFTSVPSRPFFPRGFLWDEGFHLQVILDWDMDLALEIISSWFDLVDDNGWIAREQILGPEARSKVPSEFQTQYPHYANPPTLFLAVQAFLVRFDSQLSYSGAPSRYLSDSASGIAFLKSIYPKMKSHYEWFRRTQAGSLENYQTPGSEFNEGYRWRGRTLQHVLTSGLDDYPRAQPPHPEELHVDALCWVGSMAVALKMVSAFLGEKEDEEIFSKHETDIVRSIDGIHWSEPNQAYCDTTVVNENQVESVCHKGYISLFPFLVGLLGPNHSHLEAVLDLIHDSEELWSPYGIRSLSYKDKYYGSDENYWRSPIWININYMVVQRLLELAQQSGRYQEKAREIYVELRLNLGNTVFKSWQETGFAWEQYSPDAGKGQRTQHFTGWTSLTVSLLAMPDLRSGSQPQMPGQLYYPSNMYGWDIPPILMAMGMLLICFMFRRRLMRVWRGFMGT
ncbi:Processing alpha glucosidase I [Loxospora ochrophaea]|nr:Processing alpha glucosidase I [Loxospora ochrophaea]